MDLYRKIAGAVFVMAVLLAGAKTSPAAAQAAAQAKSAETRSAVWKMLTIKGGRHNRFLTDGYSSSSSRKMAGV